MAHLAYIDDSQDHQATVCTALVVADRDWRAAFQAIRQFRRDLRQSDGIHIYQEFHAWKFVSGRGRIGNRVVPKGRRCAIFDEALLLTTQLPNVVLFNACGPPKQEALGYERLLNRINKTMDTWGSHAVLVWDEGKDAEYRKLARRMHVYNPIPSQYGQWETGNFTKNIPLDRIVEDPFFKDSRLSYFIQLVDFCAYALLRKEIPVPSKSKYGLDRSFGILDPILFRDASPKDPEGIVRF
jgi:hypothetical protein